MIVLVTAHMLADYAFQGPGLVQQKEEKNVFAFIKHVFSYAISAMVLSVYWFSWRIIAAIFIQTFLHGIIDVVKILVQEKKPFFRFELEVGDLVLHILIIWLTLLFFRPMPGNRVVAAYFMYFSTYYKCCIYVAAIVFLMRGGTSLVRAILGKVKNNNPFPQVDKTGRLIGEMERLLIFLFILSDNLTAIGFVIAAKSVARFEEMKIKGFAEYYLIGTLSSCFIAIMSGELVLVVIG